MKIQIFIDIFHRIIELKRSLEKHICSRKFVSMMISMSPMNKITALMLIWTDSSCSRPLLIARKRKDDPKIHSWWTFKTKVKCAGQVCYLVINTRSCIDVISEKAVKKLELGWALPGAVWCWMDNQYKAKGYQKMFGHIYR